MAAKKRTAKKPTKARPRRKAPQIREQVLLFQTGLAHIEWSQERGCWRARLKGVDGEFDGPTPCEAANQAASAVDVAFEVLKAYGVDVRDLVAQNPHLAGGLVAFKQDLDAAHQLAHIAAEKLEKDKRAGRVH